MKSKKAFMKKLRIFKITAMIVLSLLAVAYFLILMLNPAIRGMIAANEMLLSICVIAWLCLIISFAGLCADFFILKKHYDLTRELYDLALLDRLTGLPNRYSIDRLSSKYEHSNDIRDLGCVLIMISNLKELNEKLGRDVGDKAISDFCSILESIGRRYGTIGRNSGNEFLVILENCDSRVIEMFLEDLENRIHSHNVIYPEVPLQLLYTSVLNSELDAQNFYSLITGAYRLFPENTKVIS